MIGFIGMLSIVIACLGLLGITLFTIQSKCKEISIRKVMGASSASLIRLLSKSYLVIIIIAILSAVPVTILLGTKLLEGQGQYIALSARLLIPGVVVIIFLSLLNHRFTNCKSCIFKSCAWVEGRVDVDKII